MMGESVRGFLPVFGQTHCRASPLTCSTQKPLPCGTDILPPFAAAHLSSRTQRTDPSNYTADQRRRFKTETTSLRQIHLIKGQKCNTDINNYITPWRLSSYSGDPLLESYWEKLRAQTNTYAYKNIWLHPKLSQTSVKDVELVWNYSEFIVQCCREWRRWSQIVPAQRVQSRQPPACRWYWSQSTWDWRKKHSQPRTWKQNRRWCIHWVQDKRTYRFSASSWNLQPPGLNSIVAPDTELYLQHLTTWKKGNFLEVWMEKEVMGKEEDGEAGRPLIFLLCCLHWTESKSLISRLNQILNCRTRWPSRWSQSRSDIKLLDQSLNVSLECCPYFFSEPESLKVSIKMEGASVCH